MSKPLELTIYPRSPKHFNSNWLTFYVTPEGLMAAGQGGVIPASKRLTDAELAAEWWRANSDYQRSTDGTETELRTLSQLSTVQRFATRPHYFEAAEPESDTE